MVKHLHYLTFLLALLVGCRSERVAFRFRPTPTSELPASSATVVACAPVRQPLAAVSGCVPGRWRCYVPAAVRQQRQLRPRVASLNRQLPAVAAQLTGPAGQELRAARPLRQPRVALGLRRHLAPVGDDSLYAFCFFAGLILVGLGALTLLAGLVSVFLFLSWPAGLLVLLGLGGLGLGLLLAMFGWEGDGHWSFG